MYVNNNAKHIIIYHQETEPSADSSLEYQLGNVQTNMLLLF